MNPTLPLCAAGLTVAVLAAPTSAQWSTDPASNLVIGGTATTNEQPKIAPTADGGCYISWFSGAGYDVRLQRLDADGVAQWADNGILIADRSFSSTQDYDLESDTTGNAVLAFRDDRFGGTRITGQMIAPDGSAMWGADGVQFGDGGGFVAAPKIAAATDGSVFIGWTRDSGTKIQRLDAAGNVLWLSPTELPNPEPTQIMSDMNASADGSVIVASVCYSTFSGPKHLYAQRVDGDGNAVWPDWTSVLVNGSLQFGNFPTFVSDGAGGAVFSWYTTSGALQSWVQRVNVDGTALFAANGVPVSTMPRERVSPHASFDVSTDEIYVFWQEQQGLSEYAIFGQKIDGKGSRLWTDAGVAVTPFGTTFVTSARSVFGGCGATVFFDEELSFGNDRIHGVSLDSDGIEVWSPGLVTVASASTGKSRLTAIAAANGGSLVAWVDDDGNQDVRAQRVNLDGTLGPPPLDGDVTGDGVVDVSDLVEVIVNWGPCCGCAADVNADGTVDVTDLVEVIVNWS
ncbi:MAG: dockerin type I domain-containing protein [Planctomycetota bacterium]|jgi:hypothetical protein